ncbi:hypothetical protein BJV82DRAFT_518130 [Fennellomyces sp. T-0311]|nr:hypothetical protein BJV82DRAFT_518130 [Fennellomyces sp. T-0311]
MPLKREYLDQGRPLQDIYMASMAEKLHNETQALALLSASLGRIKSSHSSTNNSEYQSPIPQQAPPSGVDPQMMLHDRMDSLEQEIYRMKRKYKRRTDDMESEFQELQQQILALEAWKIRNERSRKSERIWILMISLSLAVGLWAFGAR